MKTRASFENLSTSHVLAGLLGGLTLWVVWDAYTASDQIGLVFSRYYLEGVVYALLTAFAVYFSVPLRGGAISLAHAVGIIAFLSLPAEAQPMMTLMMFAGALLGGVPWALMGWHPTLRRRHMRGWQTLIFIVARVTLSFYGAAQFYLAAGAPLPIEPIDELETAQQGIPLVVYALVYLLSAFTLYVTQVVSDAHTSPRFWRDNLFGLTILLLLPMPFAVMGADVARADESLPFFTVTIIGVALSLFGLHVTSRSEQRLRQQLQEMQRLSSATRAMGGNLDLDELLRASYAEVQQLLGVSTFTVALKDAAHPGISYPLMMREHQPVTLTDDPPDAPLILHVIVTRQPLMLADDPASEARQLGLLAPPEETVAWLGVPLMSGQRILGAFVISTRDPEQRFIAEDQRLLTMIATNASITIENAQLYAQKSARADQLGILNQVSALLTRTLSPTEVLDTIVSSAGMIADANAVAVYLRDNEPRTNENRAPHELPPRLLRSAGLSPRFNADPPLPLTHQEPQPRHEQMIMPGPLVINNLAYLEHPPHLKRLLTQEGKRAFVELPVTYGEANLGVIVLYFDAPQTFTEEQIDLMQAFATQAAQAISNARAFASTDQALERRVEQLFVLAAMGRLLNAALDTDKIYEIVLNYATDATKAQRGLVALHEGEGQFRLMARRGYADGSLNDTSVFERDATAEVLTQRQALICQDVRERSDYIPLAPRTRSLLIIPMLKGREMLGIIRLESDDRKAFSESDSHFVGQIANQAIIAADNTQLFQRVRRTRDRLQIILNAMEEGLILIDESETVILANPRVDLLGFTPDQLLDQPVTQLMARHEHFAERLGFGSAESLRHALREMRDPLRQTQTEAFYSERSAEGHAGQQVEIESDQGVRYLQRQVIPIRNEEKHVVGLLLVFYNKTEEYELARARDSFSQMIVHDMRGPLTAVTTSIAILQSIIPQESNYRPIVDRTADASRRAIRKVLTRVDSLLDISKLESGELHLERDVTTLSHIVESVTSDLAPLAHELDVSIHCELDPALPSLHVDTDKTERMLLNLVDNGLKYSPTGGQLLVRGFVETARNGQAAPAIRIQVIDQGPGVPDEYKQRLFDRFVQIEGRQVMRRGVGLGLTFCRLVAEAHQGAIWVDDNPAGGSIFNVRLPLTPTAEPSLT